MIQRELLLLIDDDDAVIEGLSAALESDDRRVIACRDIESAQVILEHCRVSCIISDIRFSGPFAFEGLDLAYDARRLSPLTPLILMSGQATDDMRREAIRRGAIALLGKPFELSELEELISDIEPCDDVTDHLRRTIKLPLLRDILQSEKLVPKFQRIVGLDNANYAPVGFEALARYRDGWPFMNPEMLFRYGERKERLVELELAAVRASLRYGAAIARSQRLFMNIHPVVASEGERLVHVIREEAARYEVPADHLVLEITEQASFVPSKRTIEHVMNLKAAGVQFAFDDLGIAYSHLPHLELIQPRYMKISQHFGTDFEKDPTKRKLVRNFLSLANDFGAELILEGIEGEETARVARDLGVPLGQGYFFGRPLDAEAASA